MVLDRLSFLLKNKHSINGLRIPVNSYKTTAKELQNSYKFFDFAGIKWVFWRGDQTGCLVVAANRRVWVGLLEMNEGV